LSGERTRTPRPERVETHLVELPLRRPFVTSFGEERARQALLVRLVAGELEGWGECVVGSGPWFSSETVGTAQHVIESFIVPLLRASPLDTPGDYVEAMAPIRGHPMAKAGVEAAAWDLAARANGQPLWRLFGGVREEVPSGVSIGIQPSVAATLGAVAEAVDGHYRRVKLKIKPGWDVDVLTAVRERFPDLTLSVDANAAYRPSDADHLRRLDRLGLLMIEQPLTTEDLVAHAHLARTLATAICLDESIGSPHRAWEALELEACQIINIKQGRVGGPSAAIAIHDLAHARDVPVWCGGMLETGIGRALNVALATLPGFTLPGDISATHRYWDEDIAFPHFEVSARGTVPVPDGPGLGVEVSPRRLEEATSASWRTHL